MPVYDFECKCGHEYEVYLSLSNYKKKTHCPKCQKVGKKVLKHRKSEPGFSDKVFPYYDKALNKIFQNKQEKSAFLKKHGYHETGSGSMKPSQERLVYSWRQWGREARNARRD